MARIGIVGSSFSQGSQPYFKEIIKKYNPKILGKDKKTLPFEKHLKNYFPNFEFFNFSESGQGSERYLENILYLHKLHNIKYLLVENVEDRSQNTTDRYLEIHKEILEEIIFDSSKRKYYAEKFSIENYKGTKVSVINKNINFFNDRSTMLTEIPSKKVNNWIEVQNYLHLKSTMVKILGVKNIENAETLCEILGIKTIHWSHRQEKYFRNDRGLSVKSHIAHNWGTFEQYSSDGTHCNDYAVDKLCQEYFKPLIENVL